MALTISAPFTAINPFLPVTFSAMGGTPPYAFSVLPSVGGAPIAGGTIDPVTGIYTAPQPGYNVAPVNGVDTIQVTDSTPVTPLTATTKILVGTPLHLVADIIAVDMGLGAGRAWTYDQKVIEPTDPGLWIVVGILTDKVIHSSSSYQTISGVYSEVKRVTLAATITIDIKSRDTSARDRRHEISMALTSTYAKQQQNANGFKVGPYLTGPIDLSKIDGAAVPFYYQATTKLHFGQTKIAAVGNFTQFQNPGITVNQ